LRKKGALALFNGHPRGPPQDGKRIAHGCDLIEYPLRGWLRRE